jgi:hypothetical protein
MRLRPARAGKSATKIFLLQSVFQRYAFVPTLAEGYRNAAIIS